MWNLVETERKKKALFLKEMCIPVYTCIPFIRPSLYMEIYSCFIFVLFLCSCKGSSGASMLRQDEEADKEPIVWFLCTAGGYLQGNLAALNNAKLFLTGAGA